MSDRVHIHGATTSVGRERGERRTLRASGRTIAIHLICWTDGTDGPVETIVCLFIIYFLYFLLSHTLFFWVALVASLWTEVETLVCVPGKLSMHSVVSRAISSGGQGTWDLVGH